MQYEQASFCSEMGPYFLAGKRQYLFFDFQSPDGKNIASGAFDVIIYIFDVASGKLVHTL
jgi:WD40 repeat protein